MPINIETEIALLKENDKNFEKTLGNLYKKLLEHMERANRRDDIDQKRHIENIKMSASLKEALVKQNGVMDKYIDVKIKEQQLWIEENFAKRIEHVNLQKEVATLDANLTNKIVKIENIF